MPRLHRALVTALWVALALGVLPESAHAQNRPPEAEALELKQRADRAYGERRFADAVTLYDRAYALHAEPRIVFNRARALTALARFADALDALETFERSAPAALKDQVPELPRLLAELRSKVTSLTVVTRVRGARVFLAGRALGATPLRTLRVNAGPAELELLAEGYLPYRRAVELPGGQALRLELELLPKDKAGLLRVDSPVAGALVNVDDSHIGAVPAEVGLNPGTHRVRVSREGYDTVETSVILGTGERKTLTLELARPGPITSKWWFWTGVGVLAVGGIATVFALTTERAADEGDIAPGQVSGPLLSF